MPQEINAPRPLYTRFEIYYFVVWILVFSMPLVSVGYNDDLGAKFLVRSWLRTIPYLIIFLVNQYALVPQFLLKMQWRRYILWVTALILAVHLGDYLAHPLIEKHLDINTFRRFKHRPRPFLRIFFSHVAVSYMIAGMGASLLLFRKWIERERVQSELQQKVLQGSLDSLRHQISPHFFMNTLNNIHALIPQNSDAAQDACLQLSRMMRYQLYNPEHGYTTLKNEFDFVRSYFDLMALRYDRTVEISLEMPAENLPQGYIPVLLLVTFIENAFKHGISYESPSYVRVKLELAAGYLQFNCQNSMPPLAAANAVNSGIGLQNVRKRLKLLYGPNHELRIDANPETFTVNLRIPYETALPSR